MFDATIELTDRRAADETFDHLVAASQRAIDTRRFAPTADPAQVALQFWSSGHGIVMLGITGVLPIAAVVRLARELEVAVFVHAGDDPSKARRSVTAAWRASTIDRRVR